MDTYDESSSQPDSELSPKPTAPEFTEVPDKAESPDAPDSIEEIEPKQDAVEAYRLPVEPPKINAAEATLDATKAAESKTTKESKSATEPKAATDSELSAPAHKVEQKEDQDNEREQGQASSDVDDYSLPIDAPEFDPSKGEGSDSEAPTSKQAASDPQAKQKDTQMAEDLIKGMAKSDTPKNGEQNKEADAAHSVSSEHDLVPKPEKPKLGKTGASKTEVEKQGAEALLEPKQTDEKGKVAGGGDDGEESGEETSQRSGENVDDSALDKLNSDSVLAHEHDGLAKHEHVIDHEGRGHHDEYVPGTVEGNAVTKTKSRVKWNMQRRPVSKELKK